MEFILGCNYWASNAGTEMWVNWDKNIVEQNLKTLSGYGIKYLRVFPNWRDFQPVCAYYAYQNKLKEYRHKDGSYFDNPYYIDMQMIKRFEDFCKIAEKCGMRLIVGLLTGWMSGRTFVPPLLEGKNLFEDELALVMEQKFIKGFVSYFEKQEVIYAWDLGNECNCMSQVANRDVAAAWTVAIVNAIKANDSLRRPVVSGMHSLGIDTEWSVFDHGENVDILTTHPYPPFVKHCFKDDMTSFRTLLHATCEGIYYSDLGGKPCLTEEIGTLGPMTCDDEIGSDFLKVNLYSNWANGSLGVMWWCGYDQVKLDTAPYTWCMMERELGLMDREMSPRQTLLTYQMFSKWINEFGRVLPAARRDAICVLTAEQEQWGVAYMSYALAKQTHVNLQFYYGQTTGELPDSKVYLLPSIAGYNVLCKETLDQILKKVWEGAVLYISNDTGYLAEFEKIAGVHVVNSKMILESCIMNFTDKDIDPIAFTRTKRTSIRPSGAQVLAYDDLGLPVFTQYNFGKGFVYYLNFPLESMLLDKNEAFDSEHYRIYEMVFEDIIKDQPIMIKNKWIGATFHNDEDQCDSVLINYSDIDQEIGLTVNENYEVVGIYGNTSLEMLGAHEAMVITLKKCKK